MKFRGLLVLCATALLAAPVKAEQARPEFVAGKAPFAVSANGKQMLWWVNTLLLMPGESLKLDLNPRDKAERRLGPQGVGTFQITQAGKSLLLDTEARLQWQPPEQPGHYPLTIVRAHDQASVHLQVFVLAPRGEIKDGKLEGYRIGKYPPPLRGLASYQPPRGFIRFEQGDADILLSPHFTLGQFLCKQPSGYPKFVLVQPKLLDKLEGLLAEVNAAGVRADSFTVMSGYRTPHYNRAIGNVANSRHIYGGAADIYIDEAPQNGVMDDVNGDGRVDIGDADWLYRHADTLPGTMKRGDLKGGVGLYRANSAHGPFVHVDVRGTPARWGKR